MNMNEFDAVFTKLVTVLTTEGCEPDFQHATDWFKRLLIYHVPYGKKTRGRTVVKAFKCFAPKEMVTEDNVQLAAILGWCIEMLQANFLIMDDIMDFGERRRGKLCWHKMEGVGFQAIIDADTLETALYFLLKKYFKSKDYYVDLFELFVSMTRLTLTGQTLDSIFCASDGKVNFDLTTMENARAVAKYKTGYYTFVFPVICGMYMAGYPVDKIEKIKPVLLEIGWFYQVQDDYIDVYGDTKFSGKIGSDIDDGKCNWMIVTALERASESQKKILMENFGKSDKECVAKVKAVYDELQLAKVTKEYEEYMYKEILTMIDDLKKEMPVSIIKDMVNELVERKV